MLEALYTISRIEDKYYGGDWDEIEEARTIAETALAKVKELNETTCSRLRNDDTQQGAPT